MLWVLDTFMEGRNEPLKHTILIEDAIRAQGHDLITTSYVPFSETIDLDLPDPQALAICYGTVGMIRQMRTKYPGLRPGGFWESSNFSVKYCEALYGEWMLNYHTHLDGVDEIAMSEMEDRLPALVEKHGPLFVRPNFVGKAFTGSLIGTERYSVKSFLGYIDAYSDRAGVRAISEQDSVMVRKPVDILGEYRFVCTPGEIIAASQYRYDRKLDERSDIHPRAWAYAETFLREWVGPDLVYVMDVAVLEDETARIIEFNNFSNCGLYACDRMRVVERVSAICEEMFE